MMTRFPGVKERRRKNKKKKLRKKERNSIKNNNPNSKKGFQDFRFNLFYVLINNKEKG